MLIHDCRIIRHDGSPLGHSVSKCCRLAPSRSHSAVLFSLYRAQSRQAIQVLDDARDAVQTLHVGGTYIMTGSVDGHVRTYDLRKGELRADYLARACLILLPSKL